MEQLQPPRRCGWFDAVVARYGVLVGGLTSMAITKIDVFDTFDEIKFVQPIKIQERVKFIKTIRQMYSYTSI